MVEREVEPRTISHGGEVERLTQVATLRDGHRRSGAEGSFAPAALTHGQPLLLVKLMVRRIVSFGLVEP